MSTISPQDFDVVRTLVADGAGIVLDDGKQYLVESRLTPVARQFGHATLEALFKALRRPSEDLRRQTVEALTTNETTFFRDTEPFEALKKHVIPRLLVERAATRDLRIWYGASSTGQEPYSVVMLLLEHFPALATWNVTHLATDLNLAVLERARAGRYSQIEINRGLPATYLVKYFSKVGTEWQLEGRVRDKVRFESMNLVKPWPAMASFDVIMMRNVMIYFDIETKRHILERAKRLLRPGGYLFLGGAESPLGLCDGFHRVPIERAGCYSMTDPSATARKSA